MTTNTQVIFQEDLERALLKFLGFCGSPLSGQGCALVFSVHKIPLPISGPCYLVLVGSKPGGGGNFLFKVPKFSGPGLHFYMRFQFYRDMLGFAYFVTYQGFKKNKKRVQNWNPPKIHASLSCRVL